MVEKGSRITTEINAGQFSRNLWGKVQENVGSGVENSVGFDGIHFEKEADHKENRELFQWSHQMV